MKQTAKIISTYSSDAFGICSALYELGGMVIMHDPSGCNSTYTTHDEPRWYNMDSQIYISALTEIEAIMGNDDKIINDVVRAALELKPNFIAIVGTTIPTLVGFDFSAVSKVIEKKTGIKTIGFNTNNMNTYANGQSAAFLKISEAFIEEKKFENKKDVNILGITPLDFSYNNKLNSETTSSDEVDDIIKLLLENNIRINSTLSMGSSLAEVKNLLDAKMNLVMSVGGLELAKYLYQKYNMPYILGIPIENSTEDDYIKSIKSLLDNISTFKETNEIFSNFQNDNKANKFIIGEPIRSISLSNAIYKNKKEIFSVISPVNINKEILRSFDNYAIDEDEILPIIKNAEVVIADNMYKPIVDKKCQFINNPTIAFSGRTFAKDIKNIYKDLNYYLEKI